MHAALPPVAGEIVGEVVEAQPVSIHGDIYYDIVVCGDGVEAPAWRLRAPTHVCPRPPVCGDRIAIRLLMQQVIGLEFRP